MQLYKSKKGFTLLELMIVVIIIGILASLAIPRFIKATANARLNVAASILATIRSAQFRYNTQYNAYTSSMDNLDLDIVSTPGWTVNDPAGTVAELGNVLHVDTGEGYTINEDGVVTGP